eukprot:TRINITY_DN35659_c0_g1_i1.p2 TRINITY_DN35659_c0_g1~~TRINITY_DN35659_c0_g1_i1.p2  ORF type:complete len:106 (-),score=13.36 TRINITY_DN35659_c0_g1_i1:330-647(-)
MTGKAKPKKHTAKDIQAKVDAATTNRGGGRAGAVDRLGLDKGGHARYACAICKTTGPDVKTMKIHHEAKHPKLPYNESELIDQHALAAPILAEKVHPGVRGSKNK